MIEKTIERNYRNRFDKYEEETYSSLESSHNNNLLFVCEVCGTNMPIKEKEDHLLCHEIESEERKNDIVINVPPNEVNEQNSQCVNEKFIKKAHAFDYYPTSVIKDINRLADDKKRCAICLDYFKNGDESIILPCAHIFHSKCIRRWVKRKKACPFCNYKINIPRLIRKTSPFLNDNENRNRNRNSINSGTSSSLSSSISDYSGDAQSYENENTYNSNINSIDYSSSYYNSNANSILHLRSNQNVSNQNSFNSSLYTSNSNSVETSNSNLNSNAPSNSNTNSYDSSSNCNQMNDSQFDYIKENNSIKNKENSKNSLNNSKKDINKFKNNQNKEVYNYSIKNITSIKKDEEDEEDEEDEKDNEDEEDEEDEKDNEDEDEDEDEKEDAEKNELQKNIKRYENISIDNNIEILYILNPKRNSKTTYINKNNFTKNGHRASVLSSKINYQNLKYNYLDNLPLKEKINSRKRSNSTEMVDINTILNKKVLVENKNTEILLYKLKNLNISLEKEKSYVNYFKNLSGKDHPYNKNKKKIYNISNDSNNQKNIISSPIEIFIKNEDNLHKKVHKSNIFNILRKHINIVF